MSFGEKALNIDCKRKIGDDLVGNGREKRGCRFVEPVEMRPVLGAVKGVLSCDEMKERLVGEETRQRMKLCGLTDEEIRFKMRYDESGSWC
jgi:hypothetical protein